MCERASRDYDHNHNAPNDGNRTDNDAADDYHALLVIGSHDERKGTRPRALFLYDFFLGEGGVSVLSSLCASSSAAWLTTGATA